MPKPKPPNPSKSLSESQSQPPSWPPFKPPLPVTYLAPEPHPSTSKIVLVPTFFPRNLCKDYVSFLKTLPLTTTPSKPKKGNAVRVNDRFQIEDAIFSRRLWEDTGLKDALAQEDVKDLWCGFYLTCSHTYSPLTYTGAERPSV